MTIPDEVVQAIPEAISDLLNKAYLLGFSASAEGYNSECPFNDDEGGIVSDKKWLERRDSLLSSLALPFLQGVKVKALEWDGQLAKTQFGNYTYAEEDRGWRYTFHDYPYGVECDEYYSSEAEVIAAAQSDYEARVLSAIEPAPSPRAQALEEELFDEMTRRFGNKKYIWETSEDHYPNPKYLPFDDTQIGVEFALEFLKPYLSALSSQPVANGCNRKFKLGERLTKSKGSSWTGNVVGFYSTELTPIGYAIESETEKGSVQIYPEAALRPLPASPGASE